MTRRVLTSLLFLAVYTGLAAAALAAERSGDELTAYPEALEASWIATELKMVRNAEPALAKFGPLVGTLYSGFDMWMHTLGVTLPWTLKHHPDNESLWRADIAPPIAYPKPDGVFSFDRLSSVFLSNTNHEEIGRAHV